MPNISGFRSQKPLRVWFLGPEPLNIRYLDPLGKVVVASLGLVVFISFLWLKARARQFCEEALRGMSRFRVYGQACK